jgi:hypothetical protein
MVNSRNSGYNFISVTGNSNCKHSNSSTSGKSSGIAVFLFKHSKQNILPPAISSQLIVISLSHQTDFKSSPKFQDATPGFS